MNSVGHGLTRCAQIAERDDKMTRQMVERESKMTEMLGKLMAKMDRVSTYGIYRPTCETPICSEQPAEMLTFFIAIPQSTPLGVPLVWPSHSPCVAAMSRHVMKLDGACDKQMQVSNDVADQLRQVRRALLVWKAVLWLNRCICAYVCVCDQLCICLTFYFASPPPELQTESKLVQNSMRTEAMSQHLSILIEEVRHLKLSLTSQVQDTEVADVLDAQ